MHQRVARVLPAGPPTACTTIGDTQVLRRVDRLRHGERGSHCMNWTEEWLGVEVARAEGMQVEPSAPPPVRSPLVAEIMSPHVFYCWSSDTCGAAAGLMWKHDCGMLPVVDRHGAPVAAVTDRDICMAAYTQGKSVWQLPVTAACSHYLCAVRPEDPVASVGIFMKRHRVHRVAVVDYGGNLVGVLSIADLARTALSREDVDGALDAMQVAATLRDVFRPQTPHRSEEPAGYATNLGQLMTRNPRVCSIHDSLERAAQIMGKCRGATGRIASPR